MWEKFYPIFPLSQLGLVLDIPILPWADSV